MSDTHDTAPPPPPSPEAAPADAGERCKTCDGTGEWRPRGDGATVCAFCGTPREAAPAPSPPGVLTGERDGWWSPSQYMDLLNDRNGWLRRALVAEKKLAAALADLRREVEGMERLRAQPCSAIGCEMIVMAEGQYLRRHDILAAIDRRIAAAPQAGTED